MSISAPVSERLGFADLVDKVAADAPRRDTERLLFDDLRPELRARKIGAIRLPRADGTRLPLTEFFAFIRELAAADSNLAHSLRNHYAGIENAILDPTPSSPRLLALAADGLLFGGAAQQQSGSSGPASEAVADRIGDDEYLVSCRRYYATGSLYADYLTVSVTLDDGVARTVLIESDRPGVELPDDWDGFGQRLTGSGSIVLDHVRLDQRRLLPAPGHRPGRAEVPVHVQPGLPDQRGRGDREPGAARRGRAGREPDPQLLPRHGSSGRRTSRSSWPRSASPRPRRSRRPPPSRPRPSCWRRRGTPRATSTARWRPRSPPAGPRSPSSRSSSTSSTRSPRWPAAPPCRPRGRSTATGATSRSSPRTTRRSTSSRSSAAMRCTEPSRRSMSTSSALGLKGTRS